MTDHFDVAIIGAGVVGLAIARAFAISGQSVIVLERNQSVGMETSSRNSEVIHAGIYYPKDSLQARLCVRGRNMLYQYAAERGVPHDRIGKLIVAVAAAEKDRLDHIEAAATRNGVTDLERLDTRQLLDREPEVHGVEALWSPSTGIIDSHALMLSLHGELEAHDGLVAVESTVTGLTKKADHIAIFVDGESILSANTVVNAAGLGAADLAATVEGWNDAPLPRLRFAKGNYFSFQGRSPFRHLIYPLPTDGGLGVHATLDLSGQLRFGPDVEWTDSIDYSLDETRSLAFYKAIRNYWPALPDGALQPGYVGIRPKLCGPGDPAADFQIELSGSDRAKLIQLFGIESPGLTACLAIAEAVVQTAS